MSTLQFYWKLRILIIHTPDLAGWSGKVCVSTGIITPLTLHSVWLKFPRPSQQSSSCHLTTKTSLAAGPARASSSEQEAVQIITWLTTELGGMRERWQGTVVKPVCQGNCPLKASPSQAAPGKGGRGVWWLQQGLEDLLQAAMLTHPANLAKRFFELGE